MPGKTPLVGWLKGYMVPELMGIQVQSLKGQHTRRLSYIVFKVCPELLEQAPPDYTGMKTYLKKTFDRVDK